MDVNTKGAKHVKNTELIFTLIDRVLKTIYSIILIKNKIHNILIDKYIKYTFLYLLLFHRKYTSQKGNEYKHTEMKKLRRLDVGGAQL